MKGGRAGGGNGVAGNAGVPADLRVCFPSRAHLALMPKPICSPSRPPDTGKRHPARSVNRCQASPLFRTKAKNVSPEIDEPTSPKVTCAGQIKVRPKSRSRSKPCGTSSSKNWLSVVEEIERLHQQRKRPHWLGTLGIKKDVMHFLGSFRGLRFNMQCFGSFHGSADCSSEEEDGEQDLEEEEEEEKKPKTCSDSRAVFSKWFMVLEENQGLDELKKAADEEVEEEEQEEEGEGEEIEEESSVVAPPSNALLLMRCRSAPTRGWFKGEKEEGGEAEHVTAKIIKDEEKEKERLMLMSYSPDFFKLSTDIAKETWVVGSMDPLARSRSLKR